MNLYEFPAPFATVRIDFTSMAWCWTVVAPLLTHLSCCSLALPGLQLDIQYALCRSCKNYAYHWRVSFLCFNELILRDYSAISHWFCICLYVAVAIKTSWILNLLESWIYMFCNVAKIFQIHCTYVISISTVIEYLFRKCFASIGYTVSHNNIHTMITIDPQCRAMNFSHWYARDLLLIFPLNWPGSFHMLRVIYQYHIPRNRDTWTFY